MQPNWANVRAEFPALAAWTYLNTATFGQLPKRSVDAAASHFARRDRLACDDFMEWFNDADRIRESISRLVHCPACDLAFMANGATALSMLLCPLRLKTGDQ